MKRPEVPAGARPAGHAAMRRAPIRPSRVSALSLRNWPVSRRLVAVIVLALVMGLVFGGLRVANAANTAAGFARTSQLAVLGQQVTALAQAMENERDVTAGYDAAAGNDVGGGVAVPCAPGVKMSKSVAPYCTAMLQAQATTNAAAAPVATLAGQIGGAFPAITQTKAQNVVQIATSLGALRSQALQGTSLSSIQAYTAEIDDLFDLNDEITSGSGDPVLADEVRTLDALSRAKDELSQQRGILYAALIDGSFTGGAQQALLIAGSLESADLLSFDSSATNDEINAYLATVNGAQVDTSQLVDNYLAVLGGSDLGHETGLLGNPFGASAAPQTWYTAMSGYIGKMRALEQQLAGTIVARSQMLEQGARNSEILAAGVTGGVLLLVLIATLIVARSLVEPLRRLQADALEVATVRLPERVAELSETTDPQASLQVEPISVNSTDEIGKVARAFDQVHREAVRLAGNEALLRGNLNAMFISLSRRSVPLIERLARMIDSLEQNEDDPDRLSNLFAMDHLVTRMRRNSENLLVLAGEEPVRKWSEPVPLADVARAATSEIEQYSRVMLNIQPGIAVSGQAAADVVHLLAEIVENATMFSPRDTPVHVSGQELTSGGVLLEVRDSGVGVSPSRLAEMNWRLDNPPLIDVSVSRHMGLFAVSRLAARHGVRVRLRPALPQGLSALVWLPGNLTGREAIRYGDRAAQLAAQAAAAQPRVGNRRLTGRHRFGLRAGEDELAGTAPLAVSAGGAVSNWFRPKRPSPVNGQNGGSAVEVMSSASGVDTWSDGGWRSADMNGGWRSADAMGAPVRGENTGAGLPTRIPKANLFPGSVGGRQATGNGGTGQFPVFSEPAPGYDAEPPTVSYPPAPPRRSAEQARSRLSGFQLGSRDAAGRTPRAGEEASR